jgi:hypothetical protein
VESNDFVGSPIDLQTSETLAGTRTNTFDTHVSWGFSSQGPPIIARDYRDEEPPDGTESLSKWREGLSRGELDVSMS